jgi:hypothetical protein
MGNVMPMLQNSERQKKAANLRPGTSSVTRSAPLAEAATCCRAAPGALSPAHHLLRLLAQPPGHQAARLTITVRQATGDMDIMAYVLFMLSSNTDSTQAGGRP